MKKKIILVSFAVVIFLITALTLFKMKEQKAEIVSDEPQVIFSETDLQTAQDLQVDLSMQDRIFSQTDMDGAVNKRIPAEEEGSWLYEKLK